jgi:phosphoenolpyruvate carboxykinase (ATP)
VATEVPGLGADDTEILQPRKLYELQSRGLEYREIVDRLKAERREYMQKWEGLNSEIAGAVS